MFGYRWNSRGQGRGKQGNDMEGRRKGGGTREEVSRRGKVGWTDGKGREGAKEGMVCV